jgi:hypothetical protein
MKIKTIEKLLRLSSSAIDSFSKYYEKESVALSQLSALHQFLLQERSTKGAFKVRQVTPTGRTIETFNPIAADNIIAAQKVYIGILEGIKEQDGKDIESLKKRVDVLSMSNINMQKQFAEKMADINRIHIEELKEIKQNH